SPRTKVIMITGYAMMAVAREAMEKGAFDFISKPFKPDDLRKVIARAAEALGSPLDFGLSETKAS
ncbi:MAG: response regulator, partial [Deltaproteobacteria bacterium]|nr:response regulator [Deltaproteobacteria bacterium]